MLELLRHELDQVLGYCGQTDVQHLNLVWSRCRMAGAMARCTRRYSGGQVHEGPHGP
jgi:hypothetical protein